MTGTTRAPYDQTFEVTADDTWKSIADLYGDASLPVVFLEAFIAALSNDAYYVASPYRPASGDVGIPIVAGQANGVGPVTDPLAGWAPARIWVRNQTPASDATIVLSGKAVS